MFGSSTLVSFVLAATALSGVYADRPGPPPPPTPCTTHTPSPTISVPVVKRDPKGLDALAQRKGGRYFGVAWDSYYMSDTNYTQLVLSQVSKKQKIDNFFAPDRGRDFPRLVILTSSCLRFRLTVRSNHRGEFVEVGINCESTTPPVVESEKLTWTWRATHRRNLNEVSSTLPVVISS
jgi:hypothetical protein